MSVLQVLTKRWKKKKERCTGKHADVRLKPSLPSAGTDEDAVLMLLTSRSNDQRQQIKAAYKKAHGKVRLSEGTERAADSRQLN